jgi:hypothetical protein
MNHATVHEKLASARGAVRECLRLTSIPSPQALDQSAALLEGARVSIESLGAPGPAWDPARRAHLAAELAGLRRDLRGLGLLADHAVGFHEGWARIRSILTSGYTAQGQPAPTEPNGRFLLEA